MTVRQRTTRPRYGRLTVAGSGLVITLIAVLGGLGALPTGTSDASAAGASSTAQAGLASVTLPALVGSVTSTPTPASAPTSEPTPAPPPTTGPATVAPLPSESGKGRRVVFDMSAQRVWLVEKNEVLRSYLVSGSLTDNLSPGTYAVYSTSRHAVGIDDSGAMEYFVRFTRGDRAAIGFHSIPTKNGRPLQTAAQLGTPQSHGCIRQARADAQRLWRFAPVGSKVVVTA